MNKLKKKKHDHLNRHRKSARQKPTFIPDLKKKNKKNQPLIKTVKGNLLV